MHLPCAKNQENQKRAWQQAAAAEKVVKEAANATVTVIARRLSVKRNDCDCDCDCGRAGRIFPVTCDNMNDRQFGGTNIT